MSDRPWLQESSGALRAEREVLKQLGSIEPPPGSIDRGWATLSAALPQAAAPAVVAASGVSALAKMAAGVAIVAGAVWGGSALLDTPPIPPTPAPVAARAPERTEPAALPAPEPISEASPAASELKPRRARQVAPASSLAEEGRLLADAHRLVQQGKAAEALDALRALSARYPRSVLSQEREVLTIEALGAAGDAHSARARAERFLSRHPNSPHAARLERFVK
jgi:hypothetical protein